MRARTPVILLLIAVSAVSSGLVYWFLRPRYLVLSIPIVRHRGGSDFWWESQFSELAYSDSRGVLYLHRQVGTAYTDGQGWRTVEEAFAYFDRWLTKRGWVLRESAEDYDDPVLPESRLVDSTQLRLYCRPGDPWCSSERVALAIWPIGEGVEGFHVAIVTARPSLLRSIEEAFDD